MFTGTHNCKSRPWTFCFGYAPHGVLQPSFLNGKKRVIQARTRVELTECVHRHFFLTIRKSLEPASLTSLWVNRELWWVSVLFLIHFSTINPVRILANFISIFSPGCRPDWAEAEAARRQRARRPAGWRHRWRWLGGGWGQRPGERGGCWRGSAPLSCGERGRAQVRVFWLTARSSRAGASPELAWSLSWTAGRWWGLLCCCSSPARWWRQRGQGGRTHTLPEWKVKKKKKKV